MVGALLYQDQIIEKVRCSHDWLLLQEKTKNYFDLSYQEEDS